MGLFTRKKKTQETVSGYKLIHDLSLPLVPFGENITKSDVVMICVDRVASQCAKLKARYIKVDEKGVQSEKNGKLSFLLKHQMNKLMTPYQFIYKVVSLLLLNNNSFIYPIYSKETLEIEELIPLKPIVVEPVEYLNNVYTYKFHFEDGQVYEIPIENVIHLKRFYSKSDFFGGNNAVSEHDALLKTLKTNDALIQGVQNAINSSFQIKGILKINGMLKEADKNKQIE